MLNAKLQMSNERCRVARVACRTSNAKWLTTFGLAFVLTAGVGWATDLANPVEFQRVVAAGTNALPELTAALNGPRPDLAVKALAALKQPLDVPLLAPLATNQDGEVRAAVAWALGEVGGAQAGRLLGSLVNDAYMPAREAALGAIAKIGGAEAEAAIRSAAEDRSLAIRLAVARSVGQSGRREWFGIVTPMLRWHLESVPDPRDKSAMPQKIEQVVWTEPSTQVRLAAIQALGKLKAADSLPVLVEAMEREDAFNRLEIIRIINSMGESVAGPCLGRIVPMACDKETVKKYLPVLISNGTLAVIAGKMGDERCVPYLLETLKLPTEGLGTDKSETELFIESIKLLGDFKVGKAARPLVELMKTTDVEQISMACVESLRKIGRAAARPIARSLDDWKMAPTFMQLLREKNLATAAAREGLIKYLAHESDEVRLGAVETIGQYIVDGVLEEYDASLLAAMDLDPNDEVRGRCAFWSEKIHEKIAKGGLQ